MASLSCTLLSRASLSPDSTFDLGNAVDAGDYGNLFIVISVLTAGTGTSPTLDIQHAAVNERDRYLPFETPVSIDLTVATTTWVHVSSFTRFIGWVLSGALATDAVVTVELIAKT